MQVSEMRIGPGVDNTVATQFPDLCPVQFGTADEFVKIIERQLNNLNLPTWANDSEADDGAAFILFVFVIDDGSDCSAGVYMSATAVLSLPTTGESNPHVTV